MFLTKVNNGMLVALFHIDCDCLMLMLYTDVGVSCYKLVAFCSDFSVF